MTKKKRRSKKGVVTTHKRSGLSRQLGKAKRQAWNVLGWVGLGSTLVVIGYLIVGGG